MQYPLFIEVFHLYCELNIQSEKYEKAFEIASDWLPIWKDFAGESNSYSLGFYGIMGQCMLKLDRDFDMALKYLYKYSFQSSKAAFKCLDILKPKMSISQEVKELMEDIVERFDYTIFGIRPDAWVEIF